MMRKGSHDESYGLGFATGLSLGLIIGMSVGCWGPMPDPAEPVTRPGTCEEMCTNIERLQCPGWDGSPGEDDEMGTADDVPCVPTCESIKERDPEFGAYLGCQADAPDCDAADACLEVDR